MSDVSAIEWTDATWNPVTGCTRVSPGCARCYIVRTPPFRMAGRVFARAGNVSTTGVELHPDRLARVPRGPKIFVNSLSDLFHEDVPDDFIGDVWRVMDAHPDRTFQILTKRPERALEWTRKWYGHELGSPGLIEEPNANIWLGVSIENARFSYRAELLRQTPAAVRFISAEPLLGPVAGALELRGIDWLIIGGESGPRSRKMELAWAMGLVRQAREAGVPVFVKQLGTELGRVYDAGPKGGELERFPKALRHREFPELVPA